MAIQIQIRRDTKANWTLVNPILADGEMGYETDTKMFKFGNGVNNWNTLTYFDSVNRIYKQICLYSGTNCSILPQVGNVIESDFAGTITSVGAYCDTAGTTGLMTIDILKNGVSILSTKITIDSTETSSLTAATPAVISVNTITTGDLYTFSVTGIHTTPAKGLTVWFKVQVT